MLTTEIWGDPSRIDEAGDNAVKGNLVLSRRWYLAERAPTGSIERVLGAISAEAGALLERNVMPFSWQPFRVLMEVDAAIVQQVMNGRVELMRGFGNELGRHDLRGIYRAFLGITSPQFALAKVTALGSMYFRESTLGFAFKSPGLGEVRLVGRCMPRYMCEFGIAGWLSAVLEAAKANKISVEHTSCVHRGDAACAWECRWATTRATREGSRLGLGESNESPGSDQLDAR